jgi:hypothetical protein
LNIGDLILFEIWDLVIGILGVGPEGHRSETVRRLAQV